MKSLAQKFRKARLDFRRDEPHSIEVLDVHLILEEETGELHTDQVGHGADPDSFFRLDSGNLREVTGPDLLADETEMNRGPSAGLVRIYQRVDSCRMLVPEPCLFRGHNDSGEVYASHRRVHFPRRTGLVRLTIVHVKKRCYSTDDSVGESRGIYRRVKTPQSLYQLFHVQVVGVHGQHSHLDCAPRTPC